jgi:hypothetical protein
MEEEMSECWAIEYVWLGNLLVAPTTLLDEINPLTPELNPSAQRCLTRLFLGILLMEQYVSLIYA